MDLEPPYIAKISKFRAFSGQNLEVRSPKNHVKGVLRYVSGFIIASDTMKTKHIGNSSSKWCHIQYYAIQGS